MKIRNLLLSVGLVGGLVGAAVVVAEPREAKAECAVCNHGACFPADPNWTCTMRSDDCAMHSGCNGI